MYTNYREYTTCDHVKVHKLVLNYKETHSSYSFYLLLLKLYPFLKQYIDLYDGLYTCNKSIASFLKYFDKKVSDCYLQTLANNNNGYITKSKAFKNFNLNVCYNLEKKDYNQEVLLALLVMIKRYNKSKTDKPTFILFIYKFYHYTILERLKKICKKQFKETEYQYLYNNALDELSSFEECDGRIISSNLIFDSCYNNIKWIKAPSSVHSIYSSLSCTERRILVMYYIQENTDKEIAENLKVCRATINRVRQKIKHTITSYSLKDG